MTLQSIDCQFCSHNRREYLRGVAGLGLAGGIPLTGGGVVAEDGPPVRRSLASLRESDPDGILPTLQEGIEKLRALDEKDDRQYDNYVAIHGTLKQFTNCRHGDWLFFVWHRAYLHYFEEIVRDVTGNDRFALPYWEWTENVGLPPVFRGDDDETLVDATRTDPSTLDDRIADPNQIEQALSDPNFLRVVGGWADSDDDVRLGAGALEAPSHDYVHIRVGGNMARGNSPADPSFWAHHSMVDRLWWEYNARKYPNPADKDWLNYDLSGTFVNAEGKTVDDLTVEDVLAFPEEKYTYDERIGEGNLPKPEDMTRTADLELKTVKEVPLTTEATLGIDNSLGGQVELRTLEPYLESGGQAGQVLLVARNVSLPAAASLNAYAHVNRERHPDLSPSGPTYTGAFHFFRPPPGYRERNYFVDLSGRLRSLYRKGRLGETIPVSVAGEKLRGRSRGDTGGDPSVDISKLSVVISRSYIDGEVRERPRE